MLSRNIIAIIILLVSIKAYPQASENYEAEIAGYQAHIDSLNHDIELIEHEIDDYHDKIVEAQEKQKLSLISEINDGKGIEVVASVRTDYGDFKMYKDLGKTQLLTFPIGKRIFLIGKIDDYYKIRYKSQEGYISASYLNLEPNIEKVFSNQSTTSKHVRQEQSHTIGHTSHTPKTKYKSTYDSRPKTVSVKGYYRTTKSGKRVWVKPHKRRAPRR